MKKVWIALIASALTVPAFGQAVTQIYASARDVKDQGIVLGRWGSGTISQTDEMSWEGNHSIVVSTRNYFQGGILNFGNPVNLSDRFGDKNNLFRLTFYVASAKLLFAPKADLEAEKQKSSINRPGVGGAGQTAATSSEIDPDAILRNIRMVVTTTDGKKSEAYIAVATSSTADRGWRTVALPLQAISGFDQTNKEIKSIALSGDAITPFYVGDMRVVNDTTPISGECLNHDMNLALGDEVTFKARGYGGSSILVYTWSFIADKDHSSSEAEGQVINHRFRKAGSYTITLTVSDMYGLKKPFTTSVKAVVNP